jgi:hypothetical protein
MEGRPLDGLPSARARSGVAVRIRRLAGTLALDREKQGLTLRRMRALFAVWCALVLGVGCAGKSNDSSRSNVLSTVIGWGAVHRMTAPRLALQTALQKRAAAKWFRPAVQSLAASANSLASRACRVS